MKLGFAIKVVSAGAGEPLSFNGGKWLQKVVDRRDYFKLFKGFQETEDTISFISFDEKGCYLTIMKSIPGREGDSVSGWIFIPKGIQITGEELVEVYDYVCDVLKESNISKRQEEIEEFFDKGYPDQELAIDLKPTAGDKYGVRFIDKQTMADILSTNRFQEYYTDYECIFLLREAGSIKPESDKVEDITKQPMHETVVLIAPTAKQLEEINAKDGLYFEDGRRFESSMRVEKGSAIKLTAKRDGFDNQIVESYKAKEDPTEFGVKKKVEWVKTITGKFFLVRNTKDEAIDDVKITVNGKELKADKGITLTEKELAKVSYSISAPEYETEDGKVNFLEIKGRHRVEMHRKMRVIEKLLELSDGSLVKMTLESKILSKTECPINGYIFDGMTNRCIEDKKYLMKQRGLGAAAGAGAAFLICCIIWFCCWFSTVRHIFWKLGWPVIEIEYKSSSKPTPEANTTTTAPASTTSESENTGTGDEGTEQEKAKEAEQNAAAGSAMQESEKQEDKKPAEKKAENTKPADAKPKTNNQPAKSTNEESKLMDNIRDIEVEKAAKEQAKAPAKVDAK